MNKLSLLKVKYLRCRCSWTLKTGAIAYSWVGRVIWFNFTPYPSCIRSILNDSVSAQHRPRERKGCLFVVIKSTAAPSGPKCCSWHMEGQVFIYEAPCPFKKWTFQRPNSSLLENFASGCFVYVQTARSSDVSSTTPAPSQYKRKILLQVTFQSDMNPSSRKKQTKLICIIVITRVRASLKESFRGE